MNRLPIMAGIAIVLLLQPWQASAQSGQASAQSWQASAQSGQASAPSLTAQQQEVWGAVQHRWAALTMDTRSTGCIRYPDFRGYPGGEPDPREAESTGQRASNDMENICTVRPDLVPIEIVIDGETAEIHYHYYAPGRTDLEGKHSTVLGRFTDTLVKEDHQWRLLSWKGRSPGAGQ
jgi:hypothetical protein